ncbi:hypothetical protein [Celerinatantimonas yamalensis]|uniref:DUF1311 domain-containing protein n=1 Tax=Celerinatantimonas yamalensis TaxID=559956 RepID=A0ABW9GAG8_9GAMM
MKIQYWLVIASLALSGRVMAKMHNPYDCQKQPELCQAYIQGIVDSLVQLKAQSDMQDAFSDRALNSRSGQRYQWAMGRYCDYQSMAHWNSWAKQQQLLPEQQQWLTDRLKGLNGCQ